jgi:hypothetical protein
LLEDEWELPEADPFFGKALRTIRSVARRVAPDAIRAVGGLIPGADKLKQSNVDDRVVRWAGICPATSGAIGAAYVVGPCDLTSGRPVPQAEIESRIRSVSDVESVGPALGIITFVKADIVVSHEMTSLPLENLRALSDAVGRGHRHLEKWSDSPMGGSSAMPPAYRYIKEWIRQHQSDPRSLYSCR